LRSITPRLTYFAGLDSLLAVALQAPLIAVTRLRPPLLAIFGLQRFGTSGIIKNSEIK